MRQINSRLRKENQQLKVEIESLRSREKYQSGVRTEGKESAYRNIIHEKMKSKAKASRATAECLFETTDTLERSDVTITEWYSNFKISKSLPSLRDLQEVADNFFANYCDSYTKLTTMFECL